ncbi:MAG TPA: hypothetical protein VFG84_10720 [Gemmatimonadaceae bacterium]|nr:hypothetical protein [Gemmatimonadaceae bacterium]
MAQQNVQEAAPSRRGLAASGSIGVVGGFASLRAADPAFETGISLDLGWVGSRPIRLVVDAEYLKGHLSRLDSLGNRGRGPFYDMSLHVGVRYLPTLGHLVAPYLGAGVGVHALGSSTRVVEVDELYNRNIFGAHAMVGFYSFLTADGRNALNFELRGVSAGNVRRASLRLGLTRFFRDLAQPVAVPIDPP